MEKHVDRVFAEIERQTERLLAFLRLLVLVVLALVFWFVGLLEQGQATMLPLVGFTATTVAGLVVAGSGLFRPWLPWLFAALDMTFLSHCLFMFAVSTGQPLQLALETPAASVMFVFLATAAVRHRPYLVLYTGSLFVSIWVGVWLVAPYVGGGPWRPHTLTTDLARLSVVGLVTFALFIAVIRARRALIASIAEGRLRASLSRYVSPQLLSELSSTGEAARSFESLKAAILFADLRGFTTLAERMPTPKVAEFLNEYRRRIAEPMKRHHGMIDKFIGDGVMVVFGVPQPAPDDARNAVRGGLALLSAIDSWSAERIARGQPPVEIGVGIHYGDVIAGAVGDEHRLEYTVIGDAVNVAARVEELAATLGKRLLVSADVLAAAPGLEGELRLEPLPARALRGRAGAIQLYQISSAVNLAASRGETKRPAVG